MNDVYTANTDVITQMNWNEMYITHTSLSTKTDKIEQEKD